MSNCVHDNGEYCEVFSDKEVRQPCFETPLCEDYEERRKMSRLKDADKVKEHIRLYFNKFARDGLKTELIELAISDLAEVVDNVPTVDAEPIRHGHWLTTEAYPHRVVCSECYGTYVRNENIIEGRYKGDEIVPIYCTEAEYCPHCGAKMDEIVDAGDENT